MRMKMKKKKKMILKKEMFEKMMNKGMNKKNLLYQSLKKNNHFFFFLNLNEYSYLWDDFVPPNNLNKCTIEQFLISDKIQYNIVEYEKTIEFVVFFSDTLDKKMLLKQNLNQIMKEK